jgi:hypothetical protein
VVVAADPVSGVSKTVDVVVVAVVVVQPDMTKIVVLSVASFLWASTLPQRPVLMEVLPTFPHCFQSKEERQRATVDGEIGAVELQASQKEADPDEIVAENNPIFLKFII